MLYKTLYFQRTHPTKLEPTLTVGICHVCCADCSTHEFPLMNMPDFVILSTKQVNCNVKPGTDTNLLGNLRLSPLLRKYLNDIRNLFFLSRSSEERIFALIVIFVVNISYKLIISSTCCTGHWR